MAVPQAVNPQYNREFIQEDTGVKVRFGEGVMAEAGLEVDRLLCKRALVLSTPQQSDSALLLAEKIGSGAAGVFTRAAMHTPVEITQEAVVHAEAVNADCIVAIGGGSTIGLGKAIALRTDLPQIVIPTTYAGSEATPILGQTENRIKTTLTDPRVLPEVILYDPTLVQTLPATMSVVSGLNAMAHAVEALYAQNRTTDTTRQSIAGLQAFVDGLPAVTIDPENLKARQQTQFGAWNCGTVLGKVGMALHHKLCHTLGGSFDLPHAETHAIILPHAIAFNERAAKEELNPVARLFGSETAAAGMYEFSKSLGAPLALQSFGLEEDDLDRAAEIAVRNPYWNPQPVNKNEIRRMLQSAWNGDAPAFLN